MFNHLSGLRFFLFQQATDMRKSFEGLSALVSSELGADVLSGDVFVFINKRRDRLKLLLWDRDGFWIFYKRLEKGTFQVPLSVGDDATSEMTYDALWLMIAGIDMRSVRRRPRYLLKSATLF
jgi:transposase